MTKTLVERLLDHGRPATETQDRYTIRRNEERAEAAAEITRLASRIEELERALIPFALAGASLSSRWQGHETHWQDALPCGISAGQLRAARQALSEPSPDAPAKRIGAARYLEE